VVIFDDKVYVYNFSDLKLLDQINTYDNPKGELYQYFVFYFFSLYLFIITLLLYILRVRNH